ncbi:hypothetical protein [Albimonas pacifica]|uniref:Uncharacterized protein n=1 Tax=Albimonas pacifica TaxID=1114924 RepID=A0A1I3HKT5_9RHOB|nr:hypothetical protein [Albimonas pacifica]SFI36229.1 hypothetical protein SAMN05216258_10647 [Albimonas pacifica]
MPGTDLDSHVVHIHCRACGRTVDVYASVLAAHGIKVGRDLGWAHRLRCRGCGVRGQSEARILPSVEGTPFRPAGGERDG